MTGSLTKTLKGAKKRTLRTVGDAAGAKELLSTSLVVMLVKLSVNLGDIEFAAAVAIFWEFLFAGPK